MGMFNRIKQNISALVLAQRTNSKVYSVKNIYNTTFESNNIVYDHCFLDNVKLGKYSYIGSNGHFSDTIIGRYTSIGTDVRLISGNHPTTKIVSTHPIIYSCQDSNAWYHNQSFKEYSVVQEGIKLVIGNDVWIGDRVTILSGIVIGDGAIIGAGAVVTKNVDPYTIVVGCPAYSIGKRFDDDQIERLMKIKWWNWCDNKIIENIELFQDINTFIKNDGESKC